MPKALFYRYYRKNIDKANESILLYEELLNCIRNSREYELDSQSLAYINNTIGYTYRVIANITDSGCEKEKLLKKAVDYLNKAIKDNPQKARYLQNLGAIYQDISKLCNDENKKQYLYYAQENYDKAASSIIHDYKSYNNRGTIELEIIDCLLSIGSRFKSDLSESKLLTEINYSKYKNEIDERLNTAIFWLERSIREEPGFINGYYNLAKAYTYYFLFIANKSSIKKEYKEKAKRYIDIALKQQSDNIGALFTKRNYYEAIGNIPKAMETNAKLKGRGDSQNAQTTYEYRSTSNSK